MSNSSWKEFGVDEIKVCEEEMMYKGTEGKNSNKEELVLYNIKTYSTAVSLKTILDKSRNHILWQQHNVI